MPLRRIKLKLKKTQTFNKQSGILFSIQNYEIISSPTHE